MDSGKGDKKRPGLFEKILNLGDENLHSTNVTRLGNLWTFGNFLKPLAEINLPKSPKFLGYFCKGVKIYYFSSEIVFGQLLQTFGDFFLVTLHSSNSSLFCAIVQTIAQQNVQHIVTERWRAHEI